MADRHGHRDVPSRRRILSSSLALATGTSLVGCLTSLGLAKTGYLQVKVVDVTWQHRGRTWQDEILWAVSDGETYLRCRVASEYAGMVNSLSDIRVTDEMQRRVLYDFSAVTYVTGFCWRDREDRTCRNLRASRETFNRVQFGDRAEFVFDAPSVEVVDVFEGSQGDPDGWETEHRTFDFGALHEENGAPI